MLDSKTHIQQAKHNEQLVEYLDGSVYFDWRATCVFYAALHYVQAYFSSRTPAQHFATHVARDTAIEGDSHIGGIWNDYRSLKDWSIRARYDGRKPSDSDFKNDILKSLSNLKKQINTYIPVS